MNSKWPPCVFSLRSDSFAFSLPALRLIACSDFHTGASAPALVWLSKQALVLFFFSLRPRKHPALPGRSAEECLYAAESRHTHTHILTQPPPPHRLRTHLPVKRHRLPALNGPRRRWSPVCTRQRTHSNSGPLPGRPDGKSGFVIHSLSPHVHDEVHLCPSFMRGRTEAAVKWEEDRDGAVALPVIKWWRPFHGPVGWWRSAAGWMLVVETGTGSRPT